jgi:7-cyano-7-deazaguanine reductase
LSTYRRESIVEERSDVSEYEGRQDHIRSLEIPVRLETWENKYSDVDYVVEHQLTEFTCICPKTGQPDYATFKLTYCPDLNCVELKSLKLYLQGYREVGIFHEHVTNKILEDFVKAVKPRWAELEGRFNSRGGILTTVRVRHDRRE